MTDFQKFLALIALAQILTALIFLALYTLIGCYMLTVRGLIALGKWLDDRS